jgi:hypothetical protein
VNDAAQSFTNLARTAAEQADKLAITLEAMKQHGYGDAAKTFLNDLVFRMAASGKDRVNAESALADAQAVDSTRDNSTQNQEEPPASPPDGIQDSGIDARDVPQRFKRHRGLRSALCNDAILIFITRNPGGVTAQDISEEMSRIGLAEPKGTMLSRISKLRSSLLLQNIMESRSGNYKATPEGRRLAEIAAKSYGFNINFPPLKTP